MILRHGKPAFLNCARINQMFYIIACLYRLVTRKPQPNVRGPLQTLSLFQSDNTLRTEHAHLITNYKKLLPSSSSSKGKKGQKRFNKPGPLPANKPKENKLIPRWLDEAWFEHDMTFIKSCCASNWRAADGEKFLLLLNRVYVLSSYIYTCFNDIYYVCTSAWYICLICTCWS